MVWQIEFAVEEVGGGGESLGNIGKQICHGLVASLHKGREVEGFDGAVTAKICKFRAVIELFIQWNILGREIASQGIQLVWDDWHWCGNAIKFEADKIPR